MASGLLYRALYVLVHAVFGFYQWIIGALVSLAEGFVGFYHELGGVRSTNYLTRAVERGNKLPRHLTVLLGREEPSYKDLANIVLWCLTNRILFLSFYDYRGTLRKHQDKLEKAIAQIVSPNDHMIWHNSPSTAYKNGFIGRKIHLKIFTPTNGKVSLTHLARKMSGSSTTQNDFNIEAIDRELRKEFEFPDPDLGISCGGYLNLLGYPPWQIRITEFVRIKSHHRIRYRTFLEQLYVFGKCEQRLGK